MTDHVSCLERLEYLGDGTHTLGQVRALVPRCALFSNLSPAEAGLLAPYLDVYRCEPGTRIMAEGGAGEFLLIILEGRVETSGQEYGSGRPVVAEHGPGALLGESALIDGEPHAGACLAIDPSLIAVLHRESLARIIVEQPTLGAKVLMELLAVFSARLRATRDRLRALLDAQALVAGEARR